MVSFTAEESAALAAIDETGLGVMLLDLLAVPSITGTAAESDLQLILARKLEQLGLDVDLWSMDLPDLRARQDFPGTEAPRSEAWGLVGTTSDGHDGATLILQGHVDVVPPGDPEQWAGDAFRPRVDGDVVHGRGACDMKAGVVANLGAMTAIRASGGRLRGRVAVHLVVGEEDGGLGAFGTLDRGHVGDACIITEPTSKTLITANGGALTFTMRVPGRASHASTRDAGFSAFDAFLPIHRALADLERERNRDPDPLMAEYAIPHSLSIGTVHAGDWSSSVPDLLIAQGRLGVRLDEDPADAREEFERCVARVSAGDAWLRHHPVSVTWSGGQFAPGRLAADHYLRDIVREAHADSSGGEQLRERGAPYGSDLRLYAAAGVPTLHYGPGDVRVAHSPREQVAMSEIITVTKALVLTILRTVGTW